MSNIQSKQTEYGYEWGAAKVERAASDEEKGWTCTRISTKKESVQILVTKSGMIKINGIRLTEILQKA